MGGYTYPFVIGVVNQTLATKPYVISFLGPPSQPYPVWAFMVDYNPILFGNLNATQLPNSNHLTFNL